MTKLILSFFLLSSIFAGGHAQTNPDGTLQVYDEMNKNLYIDIALGNNRRPSNRPNNNNNNGGSSFDRGLREGQRRADQIWRDLGNSCANAWRNFESSINRDIRSRGWDRSSGGNWQDRSFNEGARTGMQRAVTQRQAQCFRDSSTECVDLGNEAALIIAENHCGGFSSSRPRNNPRAWRRECRDVAISQCQGNISNQIRARCRRNFRTTTRELRDLQGRCSNQVRTMIGDRPRSVEYFAVDYDYAYAESEDLDD